MLNAKDFIKRLKQKEEIMVNQILKTHEKQVQKFYEKDSAKSK